MAQVIKFPKPRSDKSSDNPPPVAVTSTRMPYRRPSLPRRVRHGLWVGLWVLVVLTWPVWRWLAVFDLFIQSVRTMYYWHTPSMHPGLVLLMHVLAIAALAAFLLCEPKDMK
ncbi:KleE stable inheritance protein [Massilia sp. PWRC2]|uniref:KleE stable inheritance protein n=1 Tax=Massilia sp. PWRC2 TaxID=2804626 RepID=UPI003CEAE131